MSQCWASQFGNCGPPTREHLVSQSLLRGKTVFHFRKGIGTVHESTIVSLGRLSASILCKVHNEELGRTADRAALQLLGALRALRKPMELRGSKLMRPPLAFRISGVDYGRWLCKTHCNLLVAGGLRPAVEYAQYAFMRPLSSPLRFLFSFRTGDTFRPVDPRLTKLSWRHYCDTSGALAGTQPCSDAFSMNLCGLEVLVIANARPVPSRGLHDRLGAIKAYTRLGDLTIEFDWKNEPDGARPWSAGVGCR